MWKISISSAQYCYETALLKSLLNKVYVYWMRRDGVTVVARGGSLGFLTTVIFLQFLMGTMLPGCYGKSPWLTAQSLCRILMPLREFILCFCFTNVARSNTTQHKGFIHLRWSQNRNLEKF